MSVHLALEAVGDILDNYADVIEGGNAYAGGTNYKGIPGAYTLDVDLEEDPTTIIVPSNRGTTTSIAFINTTPDNRYVEDSKPPYFAICTHAPIYEGANVGQARKITAWNNTDVTVGRAFSDVTEDSDLYTVAQGFKRLPDTQDINESDDFPGGRDHFFQLRAQVGERLPFYGKGLSRYITQLEVYLRFLKKGKDRSVRNAVFSNLGIISEALQRQEHKAGTIKALLPDDIEIDIETDDEIKIVAKLSIPLIYRITTTFE